MKILITYAYAGIGHKKAAEAIKSALSDFKGLDVKIIDVLDYTNALFKFSYPRVYLFLINRAPFIWACLYYLFDFRLMDIISAPLRRFFHRLHAKAFIKFILKRNPDIVISTHFLPGEIISGLKRKGRFKGRLFTVITDFLPHAFWIARDSDFFIAAIERTKKDLLRRGVEKDRIRVLGIPCDPVFGISKARDRLLKKLKIPKGFFNLLIMGGGFGTGPLREIVYSICDLKPKIKNAVQIIIICGKNKTLFEEFNSVKQGLGVRLSVFGYMNNIDEFMEASDCIITKPGGLTVSEALSKKLPMILIKPIPGQEAKNCKILTGFGTAVRANSIKEVANYVKDFVNFPEKTIGMKMRINLLAYPDSAKDIARLAVRGNI